MASLFQALPDKAIPPQISLDLIDNIYLLLAHLFSSLYQWDSVFMNVQVIE